MEQSYISVSGLVRSAKIPMYNSLTFFPGHEFIEEEAIHYLFLYSQH